MAGREWRGYCQSGEFGVGRRPALRAQKEQGRRRSIPSTTLPAPDIEIGSRHPVNYRMPANLTGICEPVHTRRTKLAKPRRCCGRAPLGRRQPVANDPRRLRPEQAKPRTAASKQESGASVLAAPGAAAVSASGRPGLCLGRPFAGR